jgi:hypothetical protein
MPPKVVYVAVPVAMPQHGYAQWPVAQTSKTVAVRTNTAQPRAVPVPMPVAIPQSTMSPYAYQQAMQQMQQQQPQPLMTTTITFDPRTQLVTMTQTPVLAVQPPIPAVQPPAK